MAFVFSKMTQLIAVVGEAWGEREEIERAPFVGPSGYELTKMLGEAGIHRADCFLTNVFNVRPRPNNDISNPCVNKGDPNATRDLPSLAAGKFLHIQYREEINRLQRELREVRPNIAVALGNTAAWALLSNTGISKIRGTVTGSTFIHGLKVLPTFHPAAILRDWSLRHVTVLDLIKAHRESKFPEIRRPQREVWIEPSLEDMERFYEQHLASASAISFDIETFGSQITCIGFAPDERVALVIPFHDPRKGSQSFWPDLQTESSAWSFIRRVLALPCPKTAQNGLYDIHFLWRGYGISVVNFEDDTMLLHHALQPESQKGLSFLGSVYTNEASWKLMRARGKTTIKRDE